MPNKPLSSAEKERRSLDDLYELFKREALSWRASVPGFEVTVIRLGVSTRSLGLFDGAGDTVEITVYRRSGLPDRRQYYNRLCVSLYALCYMSGEPVDNIRRFLEEAYVSVFRASLPSAWNEKSHV